MPEEKKKRVRLNRLGQRFAKGKDFAIHFSAKRRFGLGQGYSAKVKLRTLQKQSFDCFIQ
jgi:hypothetical protein